MNEAIGLILILFAGEISLIAFFAALQVFFPRWVARTHSLAAASPWRALLVGLVNFVFLGAIALALVALAENTGVRWIAIPAVLILVVLGVGAAFGLAGMVQFVAARVAPRSEGLRRTAWGTVVLSLACALPVAGWYLLLPYAGLRGLGAFILGWFQREAPALAAEAPAPEVTTGEP